MSNFSPTEYSEINVVLEEMLTAVTRILSSQFVGMVLNGSLAVGDFNPKRSDIDFIVVTDGELDAGIVNKLANMHARLRASGHDWATRLEGDYIPASCLRRYDPAQATYPHLGEDGHFAVEGHGSDMVIQYFTLREKGVVLAGPPPQTLIDPILPDDLRQAALGILFGWWQPMLTEPFRLEADDYQVYAVLTMCRILYTLRFGDVVSKPTAVRWGMDVGNGRFASLITQANAWQHGMPFDKMDETGDFIRYTVVKANKI